MLFEPGFLGTRALFYMDLATVYFAVLPLLVGTAIYFAMQGRHRLHLWSQVAALLLTIVIVVIFEIGVRVTGGFIEFAKYSSVPFAYMVVFLGAHILIALATVLAWIYLMGVSWSAFAARGVDHEHFELHPRLGRLVFAGITATSVMGCMIYLFLFVM